MFYAVIAGPYGTASPSGRQIGSAPPPRSLLGLACYNVVYMYDATTRTLRCHLLLLEQKPAMIKVRQCQSTDIISTPFSCGIRLYLNQLKGHTKPYGSSEHVAPNPPFFSFCRCCSVYPAD